MNLSWSPNQKNVFSFVEAEKGNAIVEAVAGSGKTTTIAEAVNRVSFGSKTIFLAFNKAIAEELKDRGVNARTFHSLTFMPVKNATGFRQIENNKTRKVIGEMFNKHQMAMYGSFVSKLVGLAKQAGIGAFTRIDDMQAWRDIVDHHGIVLEHKEAVYSEALEFAVEALRISNRSEWVDFNDLLYYPVLKKISLPKYDFIFVDEAQDTNAIQREILRMIMKPHSRLIAVGDPSQAIYGFRGSDSDSLNMIAEEFNCKSLPLTISYRCPQAVVKYAQQWVSNIQAHEDAPEGAVKELGNEWKVTDILPGDMVVCRTVAPLVKLAFKMITERATTPKILGKEISEGIVSLIKSLNATGLGELEEKLINWREREINKAIKKNADDLIPNIEDKYEIVSFLITRLDEEEQSVQGLIDFIQELFADKTKCAVLCSIHKAKGLENERVFWLNRSACPHPRATKPWQKVQEDNLCYVAATRAKEELIIIEED